MGGKIALAATNWACHAAERHYGIPRVEILAAGGLDENDLRDLGERIPVELAVDVLRYILERSGDAAFGLRVADSFDFRTQGHWGYAIFSCLTLRERIELTNRYLPLRIPARGSFWVQGEVAFLELALDVPIDVVPFFIDCATAVNCTFHLPQVQKVWLSYPEQPYHEELKARVQAPIVFAAPYNRIAFPARYLDVRIPGDPHLRELMRTQLDAQLAGVAVHERAGVLDEVRQRLIARLASDASLERIARDLRVSARTLRRQLSALGASFQELLEEVRRARAVAYLRDTDDAIEHVAARLGYGDPSNFRRAFRRWTGLSPTTFRHQQRTPETAESAADADV